MAEEFHLGAGGPLYRLEVATHLGLKRAISLSIALTLLPLLVLSLIEKAIGQADQPLLRDPSIYARFLVAVPIFLLAERLLDRSCRQCIEQLFGQGFVRPEQLGRVRAMLRQVGRWRDSPWPELVIAVGAVAVGVARWTGLLHPPGVSHSDVHGVAGAWYALIALPIFQFLFWRSLYRWALWARVLGGLSRVPLRVLPAHADRRGGLAFLKRPSVGYCALLLLAVSSVLCGGWAFEIVHHGAKLSTFKPLLIVFVGVSALIAFGPLLAFVPRLFAARLRGWQRYEGLVSDYSGRFDEQWISGAPRDALSGSSDIQGLADLGNVYRDSVEKMQILIFSARDLVPLLVASLIPAIPVMLYLLPFRQVAKALMGLVTGRGLSA